MNRGLVRWLVAGMAAGPLVLAAPPFDLWWLAPFGLGGLAWAVWDRRPWVAALLGGWTGGLAFFMGCLWWPPTLERFAAIEPRVGWAVAVAVAAYQALPLALTAGVARGLEERFGVWPVISAPLVLTLAESWLPFSFQAHLAIVAWTVPLLLQPAELGGAPLVSGWLLALVLVTLAGFGGLRRGALAPRARAALALAILGLIASGWRLAAIDSARARAPELKVALVQPNFGIVTVQERRRRGHRMIARLHSATKRLAREPIDLVVLSETAWPFLFDARATREFPAGHPWALDRRPGSRLLFGALVHPFEGQTVWNSAVLVGADGAIKGRYDKTRLLPIAELEVPAAAGWLRRFGARLPERPPFRRGDSPRLLVDDDLRIAALICAEGLHADAARHLVASGAQLIAVLANDTWFANSAAPHQHFALVALRAVETRRDLVRAASTGVSGSVDAVGRLLVKTRVEPRGTETATVESVTVRTITDLGIGTWVQPVAPWFVLALLLALPAAAKSPQPRAAAARLQRRTISISSTSKTSMPCGAPGRPP